MATRPKKKDPAKILLRVWLCQNGTETVKKFLIARNAETVDLDLYVTNTVTEVKTEVEAQCNYPAEIVKE